MYSYSNYQNDLNQAKKLRDAAAYLKNAKCRYNQAQTELKGCWKSEEFIPLDKKIQYWEERMSEYAQQLINWAEKIEIESKKLYNVSNKKTSTQSVIGPPPGFGGGGGRF